MRHGSSYAGVRNVGLTSVTENKAGPQPRGGVGGESSRIRPGSYRKAKSRGAEGEKEKQRRSSSRITKRTGCRAMTRGGKETR